MTATATSTFQLRWYLSVAVALLIFAVVGVYSIRMADDTTGYDHEQAAERSQKLATMQALDAKTLGTADWIDKDKGIVRIPIDEAMAQEVPVLAAKPVTMGVAIPGAAVPAPASAPVTPAANAPAPMPASGRASNNNAKPTK
jgi:hypothetical protein